MKKIKAIKYNERICFKCLKESDNIHKYSIGYRGYGSDFDNFNTIIQLCDDCDCKELDKWCNENPEINGYYEDYKYEKNISDLVDTFPIQGRELFENQCSNGAHAYNIESQDWIDIELKIAPDEIYKQYGMYSPSERNAYEERFPTCENVYLKTYKDGSGHCKCNYGAYGEKDGSCSLNISNECFYCKHYKKKGFDFVRKVEEEKYIIKSKLKEVKMYQWTCECCGEIIYTHTYSDVFSCPKCHQYYECYDE